MIVAVIQSRLGSTRLPGKVLKHLLPDKTALELMLERMRRSTMIDRCVVATTTNPGDKVLVDYLRDILEVDHYVGSEDDVLDRYYNAAKENKADLIVRLTSDCPVIDPLVIDHVVKYHLDNQYDYTANTLEPTNYPDGMDVEVFSFANLERAWKEAKLPSQREHVTFYFWQNPQLFKVGRVELDKDWGRYRLTLDHPEDLELLRAVYSALYHKNKEFSLADIITFLEANPDVFKLNAHLGRNQGWQKAFAKDKT